MICVHRYVMYCIHAYGRRIARKGEKYCFYKVLRHVFICWDDPQTPRKKMHTFYNVRCRVQIWHRSIVVICKLSSTSSWPNAHQPRFRFSERRFWQCSVYTLHTWPLLHPLSANCDGVCASRHRVLSFFFKSTVHIRRMYISLRL